MSTTICVAPITQLRTYVIKIVSFKGGHLNVLTVIFHTIRNFSIRKKFAPRGSEFFPLREVPILERDGIEENHCSFQ